LPVYGSGVDALAPGMHLGHRYRLVDRLGQGGMASVWRALDQVLDRLVAVKVLASGLMADQGFLERFRVEARAAAQLSHPHITSVFDYGEWDLPGGERVAFIVMELLEGESLAARLRRGPLPWPEAVAACAQVAQALAAAHRRGVVHRDVKPGNVVLTEAGAKVLDFGIAALTGEQPLTPSGGVLGTATYVAPELLEGELVTPAADVYGLGVVLFEALTGSPPQAPGGAGPSAPSPLGPLGPLELLPGLPREVVPLERRCLARDPDERPSGAEVAKRLRAALGAGVPHGVPLPAAGASDTALLPPQAAPVPATRSLPRARGRRRPGPPGWVLGGALGATALLVALAAALLLRPQERPPPVAATTSRTAAPAAVTSTTGEHSDSQQLDALDQLRRGVQDGVASGEIRADVGTDLDNLIGQLGERLADGRLGGLDRRVEQLRRKVDQREQEGAISSSRAQDLSNALDAFAQTLPSD
jgi:eukaryotic-like serine/threonine-protein kinase